MAAPLWTGGSACGQADRRGTYHRGAAVLTNMEEKRTVAIIAVIAAALTVAGCGAGSSRPATAPASTALVIRASNNIAGTAVLHAALRSTRRHPLGRGEGVRSLVPRPTWSTPPSPGLPLPWWSTVTLGPASQGPHGRPTGPRRHRYMPNATGAANPSARDYHKPASSSHRRSPLTPSARGAFELVKDSHGAVSRLLLATRGRPGVAPDPRLRGACCPQPRARHPRGKGASARIDVQGFPLNRKGQTRQFSLHVVTAPFDGKRRSAGVSLPVVAVGEPGDAPGCVQRTPSTAMNGGRGTVRSPRRW